MWIRNSPIVPIHIEIALAIRELSHQELCSQMESGSRDGFNEDVVFSPRQSLAERAHEEIYICITDRDHINSELPDRPDVYAGTIGY